MMRTKRSSLLIILGALVALLTPAMASATGTQSGYVLKLGYLNSGKVWVYLSGTATGQPSCATAGRFTLDVSTAAGQAMVHQLIALYNERQLALIQGTGTCTLWSDSEDVLILWTPSF